MIAQETANHQMTVESRLLQVPLRPSTLNKNKVCLHLQNEEKTETYTQLDWNVVNETHPIGTYQLLKQTVTWINKLIHLKMKWYGVNVDFKSLFPCSRIYVVLSHQFHSLGKGWVLTHLFNPVTYFIWLTKPEKCKPVEVDVFMFVLHCIVIWPIIVTLEYHQLFIFRAFKNLI